MQEMKEEIYKRGSAGGMGNTCGVGEDCNSHGLKHVRNGSN